MNEHEFRQALRDTMTVATPPAWMNESPALDLAKRAHRRRQATWASAGSAVAVMAVVAGAMVLTPNGKDGAPSVTVGSAGRTSESGNEPIPGGGIEPNPASGTETSPAKGTEPQWPNGQTDATATAGVEYDRGVTLIDELTGAVPDGYEAPDDLVYAAPEHEGAALRYHQAAWDGKIGGADAWTYSATIPVSAGGGLGKLSAEVYTVPTHLTDEGCALTQSWWGTPGGTCVEVAVGGTVVGVVTTTDPESSFDKAAAYRHPDGTVVFVAQDNEFTGSGQPQLPTMPFTDQQLVELATDARFRLG